ncbi:hypothetical protein H1P_500010 [Hyella patelloides LEGE 07179]|uniref:Uncharacterized protein n=1 Tax=Hyella patelloides LEGE 07179 TaxID=945734 RepID=A0A563VZH3_9CYAN|nr:hypothetical protein H1P_500010 [Hyella patelloides LEGE 07179]
MNADLEQIEKDNDPNKCETL